MNRLPDEFLRAPLAHRALHDAKNGRPENSRAAVQAAVVAGYGVEIDLQLSKDGQAMVFHDASLDRLTGESGPVLHRTANELGRIGLAGGDEGIPTFEEVLTLVAGRVPLLVELKDQHGRMGETDGRLESASARAVAGCSGPVAFMSFNPEMVARLASLAGSVPRGLVSCSYSERYWPQLSRKTRDRLRGIPDYNRTGASFISHEAADLHRPRVLDLKSQGAVVLCWTVRSPREEKEARQIADNVTFEGYLASMPS